MGLVVGAAWDGVGLAPLSAGIAALLATLALLADVAGLRALAVGRQVPQAWGRLFGPRLTATLYGARLGVGPLTILSTWTWWAALLIGASLGPWLSAATGAAFAVTRTATTLVAAGGIATGDGMRRRMHALAAAEPAITWATAAVVALAAAGAFVA